MIVTAMQLTADCISVTTLKPCFVFCIKGVWHSVHIDDMRDSEDMSLNLYGFCGTLISSLLSPAHSGRNVHILGIKNCVYITNVKENCFVVLEINL